MSSTATANGVPGSVGQSDSDRSARQPSMVLRVHRGGNANATGAAGGAQHSSSGNRRRVAAAPSLGSASGAKKLTPSHVNPVHLSSQSSPKSPDTPNSDERAKVPLVRHTDSVESNEQVIIVESCDPTDQQTHPTQGLTAGNGTGCGLKAPCGLRRQHSTMCPPRRTQQLEQIAEEGDSCAGLRRGWNSCENLKRIVASQPVEKEVELPTSKQGQTKMGNDNSGETLVVPVPYSVGFSRSQNRLSARKACARLKQLSASLGSHESILTVNGTGSGAPSIEHLAEEQGPLRHPSSRVRRKMTRVFSEADGLGAIQTAADCSKGSGSRQLSFEHSAMTYEEDELALLGDPQSPRRQSNW